MAVVGFTSAHDPRMPPSRLTTLYSGNTLAPAVSRNYPPPFLAALDRDYLPYDRNYMRTLKGADENIGRLLTTLDEEGLTRTRSSYARVTTAISWVNTPSLTSGSPTRSPSVSLFWCAILGWFRHDGYRIS